MADDPATIWHAAYGELELQLPRETFDMWLRNSRFIAYEDGSFIVGVVNVYAREWLNHRLKPIITRTLDRIAKRTTEITFVVWQGDDEEEDIHEAGPLLADLAPEDEPAFERLPQGETGLNPHMTFDNYAIGSCNRLAHAAAMAIVEAPALQFNPLYVQGGLGVGKSHFLQAIGNACVEEGLRTLYVSAETFTNDLIAAIKNRQTADFRDKYRSVDVLLIDDIEFLGGKDSSMEEFYHTFNDLTVGSAQIVVAGSRPPAEITQLDKRLRSRFEGGLVIELGTPDFLTRVDILEIKASQRGFGHRLSLDVLEMIAERAGATVRDLEGALNQVIAKSLLAQPTEAMVDEALSIATARATPHPLTLENIVAAVADYYEVSIEAIYGRDRSREVSTARQVVMYLAHTEGNIPLQQLGAELGGRHHSTVSYSCDRVSDMMRVDSVIKRQVTTILRTLRPGRTRVKH